ncbi:N-acetylglucosaminyltransferase [Thermoplasma volcanium GSS1]|uniref:N-acetylglucosaminyltransferase n=1 Tax=Thermoplasma volcanium (strain ATCC 51530 / DSM 4299 / JCM 9571 / NBRC 15438 / GSS1) TaxID=273116 RepID=Q97A27_THEVO|nr:glycosyltransferase [Thermoplasma volcanium]BAB60125.1 N-acetylglucosaminyltransferase [Thermoplasma volcanium GSS1]
MTIRYSTKDVTIVVPVYNEEVGIFAETMKSLRNQGAVVKVFGDSCDGVYKQIAESMGFDFIKIEEHVGKRGVLSRSMQYVDTPLVMFVDSDTVLPQGAVLDMLKYFDDHVGGVGTNITINKSGHPVSYSSEFVERVREVIFKSISKNSSVMVLDGRCAMYRADLVKPLLTSKEFTENIVMGRKSKLGDDRQITSYLIRQGYRTVKDYNVYVRTYQYSSFKKFFRQQVRWGRVGWTYFFKDIWNGTARKAGALYTFDLLYMYLLPLFTTIIAILSLIYILPHIHFFFGGSGKIVYADAYLRLRLHDPSFIPIFWIIRTIVGFLNTAAIVIFGVTISVTIKKERFRVFAYGALGLLLMYISTIYALFTFFKQDKWLTR